MCGLACRAVFAVITAEVGALGQTGPTFKVMEGFVGELMSKVKVVGGSARVDNCSACRAKVGGLRLDIYRSRILIWTYMKIMMLQTHSATKSSESVTVAAWRAAYCITEPRSACLGVVGQLNF